MKYSGPCILAVDTGTSATKAGVFTLEGTRLGTALKEYPTAYPYPTWAEQDASHWWNAAIAVIKESLLKAQVKSEDIRAVSISGQAPSCLPIDRNGHPLRPAIIWIDRRATEEVKWIAENIGVDEVRRVSGNCIDGYFSGTKLLWFGNNEPHLFGQTWKILQTHSYIILRLTGEIATDYSHAGLCSPFFDLQQKKWSREMCEATGISTSLLPDVFPSHQIVGRINAEGAKASNLAKGTPIVTGGGDFACATLGCGVIDVGQAAQMLGTAGNLLVPMGERLEPDPKLLNTFHVTGDYLTLGSIYAGGVLQWFRDQLGMPEVEEGRSTKKSAYCLLDEKATKIPAGSDGLILLPYLMGERTPLWDPDARGVYFGLTTYHTRAHMYRSALEGVAFGFRHMAEIIERQGVHIEDIIAVNGGSKSSLWRRIFSDVLNARIHYYTGEAATLLGDVALAGVGTGFFSGFNVVRKWQNIVETQEPNPGNKNLYDKYYGLYRRIYLQLKDQFRELVELRKLDN